MIFDPLWLLLMAVTTVIGLATQGYINLTFKKWSQVPAHTGLTGAQVASRVLAHAGLGDVTIVPTAGSLTDHFDPRTGTIALSTAVHDTPSVAAAGVAAHEAGHAIQTAQGYVWSSVRTAIVPVANFGSQLAFPMILLGMWIGLAQLAWLGVLMYGAAVLFQVVTLPVEFDASRRAMASLSASGALTPDQLSGARQVLSAAALTYVGAALIAGLQLLYFVGLANRD